MRSLLTAIVILFSAMSQAECYVVGDLKGYATRQHEEFSIFPDGISASKFIIELNGDNSSVSPSDMSCIQSGKNTLLCIHQTGSGQSTIETWAVYPESQKAIHTKTINGYESFNGANMFIGSIKGKCS